MALEEDAAQALISTLAPREGSDQIHRFRVAAAHISTLAPREGSDCFVTRLIFTPFDFYPRSPRGERRYFIGKVIYG